MQARQQVPSIFLLRLWPALISSTCLTSHSFFPFFALLPTTPFSFLLARTHTPSPYIHGARGTGRGGGGKGGCCSSLYANVEVGEIVISDTSVDSGIEKTLGPL